MFAQCLRQWEFKLWNLLRLRVEVEAGACICICRRVCVCSRCLSARWEKDSGVYSELTRFKLRDRRKRWNIAFYISERQSQKKLKQLRCAPSALSFYIISLFVAWLALPAFRPRKMPLPVLFCHVWSWAFIWPISSSPNLSIYHSLWHDVTTPPLTANIYAQRKRHGSWLTSFGKKRNVRGAIFVCNRNFKNKIEYLKRDIVQNRNYFQRIRVDTQRGEADTNMVWQWRFYSWLLIKLNKHPIRRRFSFSDSFSFVCQPNAWARCVPATRKLGIPSARVWKYNFTDQKLFKSIVSYLIRWFMLACAWFTWKLRNSSG